MPRQILVSYAREDAAVVAELAADLRALDHEVWLDQDLAGGQDWWDAILGRIRWCDVFLPVLSAAYLASRACTGERSYAVALDRPVLPVAVGDLGPEGLLDDDLARRQRIAYQAADKLATLRLLGAVQRLAPAPPLPTVDPDPPPAPMAYFGTLRAELDGAAALDFDRQLVLLGRLSAEAESPGRHVEVMALVQIFLARREIASFVERQLGSLSERLQAGPATGPADRPPLPAGIGPAPAVRGRDVRTVLVVCEEPDRARARSLAADLHRRIDRSLVTVRTIGVDRPVDGAQILLSPVGLADRVRRAAPESVVVGFKWWAGDPAFTRIVRDIQRNAEIRG